MTMLAAAGLGLLIGVILGGLGGGGAILTVPALVYLLGQSPPSRENRTGRRRRAGQHHRSGPQR